MLSLSCLRSCLFVLCWDMRCLTSRPTAAGWAAVLNCTVSLLCCGLPRHCQGCGRCLPAQQLSLFACRLLCGLLIRLLSTWLLCARLGVLHTYLLSMNRPIQASDAVCDNAMEQTPSSMIACSQGIHACTTSRKLVILRPEQKSYLLRTSSNSRSSLFSMRCTHHTCCCRPFRSTCTRLPPICVAAGMVVC